MIGSLLGANLVTNAASQLQSLGREALGVYANFEQLGLALQGELRLVVGQQTLNLYAEVRLLQPQPG